MEEIEVGDYVRTKGGYIAKVLSVVQPRSIISSFSGRKVTYQPKYWIDNKSGCVTKSYIIKHSKNTINLIGVGDIVEIFDVLHNDIIYIWSEEMLKALKEDIENGIKIKSIVTKEQFASMQYRLEEI